MNRRKIPSPMMATHNTLPLLGLAGRGGMGTCFEQSKTDAVTPPEAAATREGFWFVLFLKDI